MVRVLSVYHFQKQQTTALSGLVLRCTFRPPNQLLLTRENGIIEIFDSETFEKVSSFLTVDPFVEQLVYCLRGNFVLTVESKSAKGRAESRSVRVYLNYLSPRQEVKARIAGKVTPSSCDDSLEVIEFAVKAPNLVACCQVTGNVAISSKNLIFLYKFCYLENSKQSYIDFEELPFFVDVSFEPSHLKLCENTIVAMNATLLSAFQIGEKRTRNGSDDTSSLPNSENAPISIKVVQRINVERDLDYEKICDRMEINDQLFRVQIDAKTQETLVPRENDLNELKPHVIDSIPTYLRSERDREIVTNYEVQILLQLELPTRRGETFQCLAVRPIYLQKSKLELPKGGKNPLLEPNDAFSGIIVVVATVASDGFLFLCSAHEKYPKHIPCISYPFTSPVLDLALGASVLHALTENGIETYTVRVGSKLFSQIPPDSIDNICPNPDKSISLIGLRPFLKLRTLVSSDSNLILFANQADVKGKNSTTVYNLQLPTTAQLYKDIEEIAKRKYSKNRDAFIDLMEEAHLLLRTESEFSKIVRNSKNPISVEIIRMKSNELDELLKDSCMLLGDLFALAEEQSEYKQSIPYWRMAELTLFDILKRIKKMQNGNVNGISCLVYVLKLYFSKILKHRDEIEQIIDSNVKREDFLTLESQESRKSISKFGEIVLELLVKHSGSEVSGFILEHSYFMDYMSTRIFETIRALGEQTEKRLVMILYLNKRNDLASASLLFDQILSEDQLLKTLKKHYNILFDKKSNRVVNFSDFSEIFFLNTADKKTHALFIEVCLYILYHTQILDHETLLKLFMEHLSASIGSEDYPKARGMVQLFLEKYYASLNLKQNFYAGSEKTEDVLDPFSSNSDNNMIYCDSERSISIKITRMLIRLYLTQLKEEPKRESRQDRDECNDEEFLKFFASKIDTFFQNFRSGSKPLEKKNFLFIEQRFVYLNLMPPFEENLVNYCNVEGPPKLVEADMLEILIKLQALLSIQEISEDVSKDVAQFLETSPNLIGANGILSCIQPLNEAMNFILEKCPQAILQFGIDRFRGEKDWSILLAGIQEKVNEMDKANDLPRLLLFYRVFIEILEYLAMSNSLDVALRLFDEKKFILNSLSNASQIPFYRPMNDFSEFIHMCNDTGKDGKTEKLKKMIQTTGNQLFDAINKTATKMSV